MREVVEQGAVLADQFRHTFADTFTVLRRLQCIDLFFRQPEYFSEFADDGIALIGAIGGEEGGMFFSIATEDVGGEVVAVLPAEVEVEVGRVLTVGIDETFEIEIEVDGIHVGDAEAIGHDTVGATAATHVEVASALRITNDIPVHEEVSREAEFVDHTQFLLHTVTDIRRHLFSIAVMHAFPGFPFQQYGVYLTYCR
jgi:hypothetical protein